MFAQLRADPGVGLVYPSPGAFVPYWAHTWLGARAAGDALLARMGLPGRENGYLDVVAGSMMWARVAALAPFLDLGLTLEEFPPEEGQLDGTLQHAIERSFTLVARATGYSARVLAETRDRHVFEVTNRKNIDDYLRAAPVAERIAAAAADAEVVSFDVFDTLLVRPFGVPDSVFRLLEDRIARADGVPGFMARRKHAEEEVRRAKAGCGDATLREIYTALARREGVSGEVAARWMRSELDAERDLLRPRPAVVSAMEALRAAGKRIVLVSDMYLEERDLRALLDASGVRAYDAVYVSSETGLRKDSGAIWPELLRRERVAPGRLVHVGDNERTDVQLVGDLGVGRPVHVLRPLDGFELLPEGRALAGGARPTRWQDDLALGLVANRCVLHLDGDPTAPLEGRLHADPERFGYCVLGPATLGFVGWLARTAANDGVETLEFVSREGWLLKAAFDEVASHPRLRRPLPKSRYFLCSRRAAVVAALRTPDDLRLLLGGTFAGTLRELLAHRIGVEDVGAYEARLGDAALGRRVELPRGASKAFACLSDAADLVLAHAAVERAGYLDYARRLTESHAALVDVGFSGTAQSALMRLVGAPLTGYYWVTTDRVAALERAGGCTRAWLAERVDPAASDMPALRYHMLLEAVFTAPQGQLLRFEGGAGTPRPVFKPPGAAQRRFAEIARIHAGVLAYVRDALDALGDDALDLDLDRELVQRPLRLVAEGRWPVGPLSELLFVDDEYSGLAEVSAVGRIRSLAGRAPSDPAARRA